MSKKSLLIAAAALVALAAPAAAHRPWLVPSTTILSDTDSWVTVDAAISNDLFYADHNPMATENIKVWAPDGSQGKIENAAKGIYRSVFDVRIDKPGTWRIGTMDANVGGTFKVNGELWSVGRRRGPPGGPGMGGMNMAGRGPGGPGGGEGRPPQGAGGPPAGGEGGPRGPAIAPGHNVPTVADIPAGATDLDLTETMQRNEFFVTAGAPSTTVFQPTNKGLEMVPVTHPAELVSNEPARFRFLVDGRPASNLKVTVIPGGKKYRESEQAQELATGADGVLTVKWPVAGMYWMNASLSDDHPAAAKAAHRRMNYTATLEVVAP